MLQEVVNRSRFPRISIQVNAVNHVHGQDAEHERSAHSLLQTSLRPQAFTADKLNVHVLLARPGCLVPFCLVFNGLTKHSVAVGAQRHPAEPNASKFPQNRVPIEFIPFSAAAG